MLIKHTRGRATNNDAAQLSCRSGGKYLAYYPSADALETVKASPHGVTLAWDVDDDTQQPKAFRLTPAPKGGGGIVLRDKHLHPHLILPTSAVGTAESNSEDRRQTVEETVSETEITVRVPFTFSR